MQIVHAFDCFTRSLEYISFQLNDKINIAMKEATGSAFELFDLCGESEISYGPKTVIVDREYRIVSL